MTQAAMSNPKPSSMSPFEATSILIAGGTTKPDALRQALSRKYGVNWNRNQIAAAINRYHRL